MHAKNLSDRWLNLDRVQRRNGAHFSVTVKMDPKVRHAIGGIAEDAWTAINYPNAIYDEASDTWISDAEIAEVPYTAFAAKTKQAADGCREFVRRWLYTFGPGTEDDLVWWLGGTKTIVRAALADLGAVAVSLDGGGAGWLLPDDLTEVPDPGPWVALLPVLDPDRHGLARPRLLPRPTP